MLIDVDDDTFDGLFRGRLLGDYRSMIDDICRLERIEHRSAGIQRDIDYYRNLLTGMEKVLDYYVGPNWAQNL
jgi:hypothetical protein